MQWDDYIGHAQQKEWFATALRNGRLGSTFLFVGPAAIGKQTFATLLAKTLLCVNNPPDQMQPCGHCESCIQVDAKTHPDLLRVEKPADKSVIPVEKLVGPRESRMQEGLCHDIRLRSYYGRRKIAILDDADHLNQEGANCLLKTLEEPPVGSIVILIGTSLQRQLPTIRSRAQAIRFAELEPAEAKQLLQRSEIEADEAAIEQALQLAGGDLSQAAEILNEESQQFRTALAETLQPHPINAIELASLVSDYVNAAGQDATDRRGRMRQVFRTVIEFYRTQMLQTCQTQQASDPAMERILYRMDRCVEAINQVDRNANQQTLVESWSWDLQRGKPLI
ncbi:DNA polymerase III subunit tau [Rosistilla carotiformis]|uniref:DNA polymerase III subunit tau n=1 Tax=Rosistilla carotiformis TaxID=2528017 RepID=A0A518JRY5_9BACT|nr:AAA family ATPase [Rosistilla carotiformis]QDV68298.1 DNA polymerase III subunit tau [Rosistilla carotiformis]